MTLDSLETLKLWWSFLVRHFVYVALPDAIIGPTSRIFNLIELEQFAIYRPTAHKCIDGGWTGLMSLVALTQALRQHIPLLTHLSKTYTPPPPSSPEDGAFRSP